VAQHQNIQSTKWLNIALALFRLFCVGLIRVVLLPSCWPKAQGLIGLEIRFDQCERRKAKKQNQGAGDSDMWICILEKGRGARNNPVTSSHVVAVKALEQKQEMESEQDQAKPR